MKKKIYSLLFVLFSMQSVHTMEENEPTAMQDGLQEMLKLLHELMMKSKKFGPNNFYQQHSIQHREEKMNKHKKHHSQ